jgi:hypothetical protein
LKTILVIISALLFIWIESSCNKTQDQTISIVGKWKIINDTTSYVFLLTGIEYDSNYIGKSNDYYDFISDGNLYYKEGPQLYRGKYYMFASNQFQPVYFFINGYTYTYPGYGPLYTITNLTAHTATLTESESTPDGPSWEMINLEK